jgi:hypothetical protein
MTHDEPPFPRPRCGHEVRDEVHPHAPHMSPLHVGLDEGLSKTNLAVVEADGHLLLEARIDHFDREQEQQIPDEYVTHRIAQHLAAFRSHPLHLFGSHIRNSQEFFTRLRAAGLDVRSLDVFNDTHGHYGLTTMPGNAVTVGCGSYWNAMYYDQENHVHCFAGDIWQEVPWSFSGIAFARFLLSWWQEAEDTEMPSALGEEIVACTGLAPHLLRERIDPALSLDALSPARWLPLGVLISRYLHEQRVRTFLSQGVRELQQLYTRFCVQVHPLSPPVLVLGGSIWSTPIFAHAQRQLETWGIPVVHSQGNPAWGAIRFRHANPAVQLEPWASHVSI